MTTKKRRAAEAALDEWHAARLAEDELRAALGDDPDDAAVEGLRKATAETAAKGKAWDEARTAAATESETRRGDPDQVEMREMLGQFNIGRVIAAMRGRQTLDGREAEVLQAHGCDGNQIPLAVWDAAAEQRAAELRAATPAPAGAENVWGVAPAIFAASDMAYLGIEGPMVPSGTHAELVITTSLSAAAQPKSGSASASAGVLASRSTVPHRVSAALEITAEDLAIVGTDRFAPALRENLQLALSDKINEFLIRPAGSNEPAGLLGSAQLPAPAATIPDNGAPTWALFWQNLMADGADGVWSRSMADRRTLCRPELYSILAQQFRTTDSPTSDSLAQVMERQSAGLRVSKHLPEVASKASTVIQIRPGAAGSMPAMPRLAVMPTWDRIEIEDRFTQAAAATTAYYAHLLVGDVIVLQADAYRRLSFRHEA